MCRSGGQCVHMCIHAVLLNFTTNFFTKLYLYFRFRLNLALPHLIRSHTLYILIYSKHDQFLWLFSTSIILNCMSFQTTTNIIDFMDYFLHQLGWTVVSKWRHYLCVRRNGRRWILHGRKWRTPWIGAIQLPAGGATVRGRTTRWRSNHALTKVRREFEHAASVAVRSICQSK